MFVRVVIASYFLLVALLTVIKLTNLGGVPPSAGQDLSFHTAYASNFYDALQSRQWLPRLQIRPEFYPDIPVFQFYGFLMGALAAPFIVLQFSPLTAVALGLATAKWAGALCLFAACRELLASRGTSIAAVTTYLFAPYILSNVYGRIAFPEATAHMVLGPLFYGLIRLQKRNDATSKILVILSVAGLAFAHPIFLLYGAAASLLFILLAFPSKDLLAATGLLIGAILISAFQWMPGMLYQSDFATIFAATSPFTAAKYSSAAGLFWIPKPLSTYLLDTEPNYQRLFLTASVATIPSLLILASAKGRVSVALLTCLLVSLLISLPPIDIWNPLPRFTWAIQFPYRAFAFVGLFSALGIALWRGHWAVPAVVAAGVVLQSLPILSQPFLSGRISSDNLAETYALPIYRFISDLPVISSDRWVSGEMQFTISEDASGRDLHIEGVTPWSKKSIEVWFATPLTPDLPETEKYKIGPGRFAADLKIPKPGRYILVVSDYFVPSVESPGSTDTRELTFQATQAYIKREGIIGPPLPRTFVKTASALGYTRVYQISAAAADVSSSYSGVELPLAYSPLMRVKQNGKDLAIRNSINSLAVADTSDMGTPVVAHYRLPARVWFTTIAGILLVTYFCLSPLLKRRRLRR